MYCPSRSRPQTTRSIVAAWGHSIVSVPLPGTREIQLWLLPTWPSFRWAILWIAAPGYSDEAEALPRPRPAPRCAETRRR